MENCIVINGVTYDLVKREEAAAVLAPKLAGFAVGEIAKIGSHEMIVLEHAGAATLLLRKDALDKMAFGDSNNYDGSEVDAVCNEFSEEIAAIVGEDNILLHEVDLTADDGLKDYGLIKRKASLRTANMQRKYVEILDKYRLDVYEWLATAFSTPAHDDSTWVKCVSPPGCFIYDVYCCDCSAVRPVLIFESSIFESSEE